MTYVAEIIAALREEPHAMRVLPCVCGGLVRADRRFPTKGVTDHNRSKLHQAWRATQ